MSALIEIRGLLIQRNGIDALKVNSLDILCGETLAIVGPNGAGKSTLLLALAHLLKPAQGEIIFKRKSISNLGDREYRRKLSIVLQEPLLMDMTVEQNVALGLKFRGMPKNEIKERVERWLSLLGIASLTKRRAGLLSGGEAQRVSLARAFVLEPELLLLDEPFSSLDPPARAKLLKDLSVLLVEDHRTTVFVTHNLKEAAHMGDRIAVIIDSKLKQVGMPEQIKADPIDNSVKEFLKEF
jgi:ABC-type sugar transport system ATPase subunit